MSDTNYPYKPKVVLTEKQAKKEPVGSFYHPTEKTFLEGRQIRMIFLPFRIVASKLKNRF
jgi:hypothetical protein